MSGSGYLGATSVLFGLVPARFSVVTDTTLTAIVPFGASKGTISVHTPAGNVTSKNRFFKVTPQVTSFTPRSAQEGATVTIDGSAFTDATGVTFNGLSATFSVNSYSQITATVPKGATSGPVAVTTRWGTGTSGDDFTALRVFDVTDFGAHGDGTGDNTAAFKAAIASAQSTSGNTVRIPSGTYTFSTGSPASIQIDGAVPVTFAGSGRDTTTLMETDPSRDLLSVRTDGTVIQDLTLDTQTHGGGHGLGDGANNTTAQRLRVLSGTRTFGIYYSGPPGAHPGNGLHDTGNTVDDLILNDQFHGDGWSFSFQDHASITNVQHTGSRITLYADTNTTVSDYRYTPGTHGATAAFVVSTPCVNLTIKNFVTSGEGGQIKTAPDQARVNQSITIDGEQMTGDPGYRLLVGDVQSLLVENSTLGGLVIAPKIIAQGTVTATTDTSVTHRPQNGATDAIVFS